MRSVELERAICGHADPRRAAAQLVVAAGAVPLDHDGALVGPGDYGEQTRRVIANLLAQLDAGGARTEDVAKTTVYVVAPHGRGPLAEVPRRATLVGVAELTGTGSVRAPVGPEGTVPGSASGVLAVSFGVLVVQALVALAPVRRQRA